jgi:hypothetical protein
MTVNTALLSPCGLYCGVCGFRLAYKEDDAALKEKLGRAYGVPPETIACEGCRSDAPFAFCASCAIRACANGKGYEGCHQCGEFPCALIEAFPFVEARKRMKADVPEWRELGTEAWVAKQEAKYRCAKCGAALFRGAKRCRVCKEPAGLD